MARVDTSKYQTFSQITGRLDDIVMAVRDKDVSLEKSLDLFDEAIALGSKAVDMVDATDFSPEEEAKLEEQKAEAEKGEATAEAGDEAAADADAEGEGAEKPAAKEPAADAAAEE